MHKIKFPSRHEKEDTKERPEEGEERRKIEK
jgi:hypothetical protein